MADAYWYGTWVDTVRVAKAAVRSGMRDYVVAGFLNFTDLRTTATRGTRTALIAGIPFTYDSTDTTTADDGANVIVSADGQRYKKTVISGGGYTLPVATSSVLGGVKQGAGVAIAADGTLSVSGSTGGLTGYRNKLRNGQFLVNQRAVSGTVTLAAGAYGHDGVKAGASGATYTFALVGTDTTLTVTAGSLIMPVESTYIEAGVYVLSHAGTALCRVWQGTGATGTGTFAASPITTAALTVATQTNAEFSTGTIIRPQLELAAAATAFERRPLATETVLCQRYYCNDYATGTPPAQGTVTDNRYASFAWSTTAVDVQRIFYPVRMRATPTITFYSDNAASANWYVYNGSAYVGATGMTTSNVNDNSFGADMTGLTGLTFGWGMICRGHWAASAEI